MLMDLYQKSDGNKKLLLKKASKSFDISVLNVKLSPKDIATFQRTMGQYTVEFLDDMAKDKKFAELSEEQQIEETTKLIKEVADQSRDLIKSIAFEGNNFRGTIISRYGKQGKEELDGVLKSEKFKKMEPKDKIEYMGEMIKWLEKNK
jgi:hypothetical protein